MKSRKPSAVAARVAQYAVLCLGAFFTLLPFLWMISSSLKTPAEIVRIPPVMIPETALLPGCWSPRCCRPSPFPG